MRLKSRILLLGVSDSMAVLRLCPNHFRERRGMLVGLLMPNKTSHPIREADYLVSGEYRG